VNGLSRQLGPRVSQTTIDMKYFFAGCLIYISLALLASNAYAQFSPGELSQSHAHLEGMDNCTQCHDLGKKIESSKCLDCHILIKQRIDRKQGYHASNEVRGKQCYECHHDHNGRSFKMIVWKPSKEKFDHDLTGYKLEGKHRTDKCEPCHKSEFIKTQSVIERVKDGLDLNSTHLGLSQECRTCHFDEHRGQLNDCAKCHDFVDWKKSSSVKFDHNQAAYPLTGSHVSVACLKCHPAIADAKKMPSGKLDADYFNYKRINFSNCTPCHADPHQNKFGQDCQSCHSTFSWLDIKNMKYDHGKTRYPLLGLHAVVACEKCHQPDLKKPAIYKNMKFSECRDCHADAHAGQLAVRTDKGKCETCHDVKGFHPSLFTVAMHNSESKYLLQGAHEKVECVKCHVRLQAKLFEEKSGFRATADTAFVVLKFVKQQCSSCHADIHGGQFADKLKKNDCDICHKVTVWKDLKFDHDKDSEFALLGKHKSQSCEKCHPTADSNTTVRMVVYRPLAKLCEGCHKDIHEDQFAPSVDKAGPKTYCDRCHNNDAFKPSSFDHNRQSRYSLTGAHIKVACNKCHIQMKIKTDTLTTLYKPISMECASCHPDQHNGAFELK